MRAIIFGASGGIGKALVEELRVPPRCAQVMAGARRSEGDFRFSLQNESSIRDAAESLGAHGPYDLMIVATGMLHQGDGKGPEKSWRMIDPAGMAEMFAVNTIGPALIAKHFLPLLRRDGRAVFAVLTARVGSISDNRSGGWHSYRASKAALNMLVRNLAIEMAMRNKDGIVVALHPGTVDTALSAPFQRNVAPGKLFTPSECAAALLGVIDELTPADSGQIFAWDGQRIPF